MCDSRQKGPPFPTVSRAMAVTPHADDVTLFAGGTIARWAANGCEALVVRVTNDEKDSFELGIEETIAANRKEFEAAMKILGVRETVNLDYRDCELMDAPYGELREKLVRQVRTFKPDIVVAFDPFDNDEENPDHIVSGRAAADAAWAAGYPNFCPEHRAGGLKPHLVQGCLFFTRHFVKGGHAEDIAATLGTKVRAVAAHKNMMRTLLADQRRRILAAGIHAPAIEALDLGRHAEYLEQIVTAAAEMAAQGTGLRYAERFRCTAIAADDPLVAFWKGLGRRT